MRKSIIINFVLFVFLSVLQARDGFPWDNDVTHKDLSEYAANNSVLSKNKGDYLKVLDLTWDLTKLFYGREKL